MEWSAEEVLAPGQAKVADKEGPSSYRDHEEQPNKPTRVLDPKGTNSTLIQETGQELEDGGPEEFR